MEEAQQGTQARSEREGQWSGCEGDEKQLSGVGERL